MEKEARSTLSIKLLIDKHNKKVLYAEAGKDFIDFLFHVMTLPVGAVVRLLKAKGMVGCLGTLYGSIESIGDAYMESPDAKKALLQPKPPSNGPNFPLLLPDYLRSVRKSYYKCGVDINGGKHIYHSCCPSISDNPNAECPKCRSNMRQSANLLEQPLSGYVKEVVMYIVTDDLEVQPMSTISSIAVLNRFNVKDVGTLELKEIAVGMDEAVELLKTSLYSKTVLTDVFFG